MIGQVPVCGSELSASGSPRARRMTAKSSALSTGFWRKAFTPALIAQAEIQDDEIRLLLSCFSNRAQRISCKGRLVAVRYETNVQTQPVRPGHRPR